jgi:hypothetical protein
VKATGSTERRDLMQPKLWPKHTSYASDDEPVAPTESSATSGTDRLCLCQHPEPYDIEINNLFPRTHFCCYLYKHPLTLRSVDTQRKITTIKRNVVLPFRLFLTVKCMKVNLIRRLTNEMSAVRGPLRTQKDKRRRNI